MSHSHFDSKQNEAMPIHLPSGIENIAAGYLDGQVNSYWQGDQEIKKFSETKRQEFRLFGRSHQELLSAQATQIATLILSGEEKDVTEALDLVAKNPDLLYGHAIAKDLLGRTVKGTPLQIAAMAGDVNLKEGITEEKDMGLVERLIKVGKLSQEEIAEQLQVITSKKSEENNAKRNKRVLDAIIQFGNGIVEAKSDKQTLINNLDIALKQIANEGITSGYIFDPAILRDAAAWFENNVARFGGWWNAKSDMFWVNGFGKLQSQLSSRDAHVVRAGIGNLIDDGNLPGRTLKNNDGTSYFFNLASGLGSDFYLGYYAQASEGAWIGWVAWKTYVEQKQQLLQIHAAAARQSSDKIESVPNNVIRL